MEFVKEPEFWVGVSFILFCALLVYYGIPQKAAALLDARAELIRKELAEARKLREEAEHILAEYKQKREEADREAEGILEQAKREAEAMASEMRQKMKDQLERRTKLAEDKIARAESQALTDVRYASVEAAVSAAEALIARKLTTEARDVIVEKNIEDVKARLN